ncbi:At4g22758 [Fagus crenata]
MLKRSVSEKTVLLKHKKNMEAQNVKTNRFLITVNVHGSVGPIRFVVNEDDLVAAVIDTTLKSYSRFGRLPVLGSDKKSQPQITKGMSDMIAQKGNGRLKDWVNRSLSSRVICH